MSKLQKDKAVAAGIEAKVKRIEELERCLEETKQFLIDKRPYVGNSGYLPKCGCIPCTDHREITSQIRRITHCLRKEK